MLSSIEVRAFNALREKIQEEMGSYISNLDSIPSSSCELVAIRFREEQTRFNTFEEVLSMIDELQEELGK